LPEEIAGSPLEIREVAEWALVLQRYLLRRAWGVAYATWSVALFLTNFGAPFEALLGLSVIERIAVSTLASGAALTITLLAFKRVRNTVEIRRLVIDGKWRRVLGYQVLATLWVAVYLILFFLITLFGVQEDPFVLALYVHVIYAVFWAFLYYALRLSFEGRMPAEGKATLSSFGAATLGSIINDLSLGILGLYALLWGVTIIVWVVSAFYARRQPVPGREVDLAV
jgi:hypothetical protein